MGKKTSERCERLGGFLRGARGGIFCEVFERLWERCVG